jgi:tetratricopeptide (TPR) repeat protein
MRLVRTVLSALAIFAVMLPAFAADDQPSEEDLKGKAKQELASAKALIDQKQYKKAISHLKEARDADSDNADIHNYLGYSYRKLGSYEKSMVSYDKALDLDPDHKGALEYKGELFLKLDKPEDAKELAEKLKTLCPSGCEELTDLQEAIAAYKPTGR